MKSKRLTDEVVLERAKKWREACGLNLASGTRREQLIMVFEFVVKKYGQADLDWFIRKYNPPNAQNLIIQCNERYMYYLERFHWKLWKARKSFREYVANHMMKK